MAEMELFMRVIKISLESPAGVGVWSPPALSAPFSLSETPSAHLCPSFPWVFVSSNFCPLLSGSLPHFFFRVLPLG